MNRDKNLLTLLRTLKFHAGNVVTVLVYADGNTSTVTGILEFSNPSKSIEKMTYSDYILVGKQRVALRDIQDIDFTP